MRRSKNGAKGTAPNTDKCDLLVVEDDESTRYLVGEIIQRRFPNLRIQYAEDGLEGLKKAKAFKPHIVWTGEKMPRMGGLEMIELIRQNPELKNTKIILCTGCYAMEDVKTRALKLGVDRFWPKPFKIEEALSVMGEWVKHETD